MATAKKAVKKTAAKKATPKKAPAKKAVAKKAAPKKAAKKAAQEVIAKDREQRKPFERTNPAGDTYKKGGKVRGHGIEIRGKTKGRFI